MNQHNSLHCLGSLRYKRMMLHFKCSYLQQSCTPLKFHARTRKINSNSTIKKKSKNKAIGQIGLSETAFRSIGKAVIENLIRKIL